MYSAKSGMVRTGRLRLFIPRRLARTSTRTSLPMPCGKRNGAADRLIGLLGIDAETDGDIDRFDELRGRRLLHLRDGFVDRVYVLSLSTFLVNGVESLAHLHCGGAFISSGSSRLGHAPDSHG